MKWLGDVYSGCTIVDSFTTVNTSGVPTAISGTAGGQGPGNCFIVVWKGNTFTCSTAGVTQAFDCKGATGWNAFSINTNADAGVFYSCGSDYLVVLHGGTVSSNCISYYVLGSFSLKNRAGLNPTVHGRALDVSTGGEAGLDWANIGSPQTVQLLGCTSTFQVQSVCNAVTATATVDFTAQQNIACTVWNQVQSAYDTCGSFGVLLDASITSRLAPTTAGRTLDVSAGGEAGIDWANVGSPQTVQRLGCTSFYDVMSVCNTVAVSTGSITTVTGNVNGSVGSVTGAVGSVTGNVGGSVASLTTNNDKTGYRLSAAGLADFMDCILTEPSGVFAWAGATLRNIVPWLGAVTSNQIQQSASQQGLCDRAATVRIAKSEVSCSAGVVTRGSFV